MSLYQHKPHPHKPRNVNRAHKSEQREGGFNQLLAVHVTQIVGTMTCAYLFMLLALAGFPGMHATLPQYVQWFSGTFLQLVMLPVLAVGTAQLGHHQELMAEEQFATTQKIYADIETLILQSNQLLSRMEHRDDEEVPRD